MSASPGGRPRLHPVLWVAAASVTIASLVAVGAMTGMLPASKASVETSSTVPELATDNAVAPTATARKPSPPAIAENAAKHKTAAQHAKRRPAPDTTQPERLAAAYPPPAPAAPPAPPQRAVCTDCGIVESVRLVSQEGEGSGLGAVAGGVIGGALGNNVGQGNGRKLATLAGIVGGAFAGNKIEKTTRQTSHYEITVRFEDGSSRIFSQETAPPWREGDHVRQRGDRLTYDS